MADTYSCTPVKSEGGMKTMSASADLYVCVCVCYQMIAVHVRDRRSTQGNKKSLKLQVRYTRTLYSWLC